MEEETGACTKVVSCKISSDRSSAKTLTFAKLLYTCSKDRCTITMGGKYINVQTNRNSIQCCQLPFQLLRYLKIPWFVFSSVAKPDPIGSGTFSWTRIRNYLFRIRIQPKMKKTDKNLNFYFFFALIVQKLQ